MPAPPPDRVVLTLRDLGDAVPFDVRLRRLLKAALRQYRLRCVSVSPSAAEDTERLSTPPSGEVPANAAVGTGNGIPAAGGAGI